MTGMVLGPDALFLGLLASFIMICTSSQDTHTPIPYSSAEIICVVVVLILVGMAGGIVCEHVHEYMQTKNKKGNINKCMSD